MGSIESVCTVCTESVAILMAEVLREGLAVQTAMCRLKPTSTGSWGSMDSQVQAVFRSKGNGRLCSSIQ